MARGLIVTAFVTAVVLGSGAAFAQQSPAPARAPAGQAPQCFRSSDWQGWKATPDGQTMYVNAGINRTYRFDFVQACPELNSIGASLLQRTDRPYICRPIDVNIRVVRPGLSISYCQVKTITRLSVAEGRALPRALRP